MPVAVPRPSVQGRQPSLPDLDPHALGPVQHLNPSAVLCAGHRRPGISHHGLAVLFPGVRGNPPGQLRDALALQNSLGHRIRNDLLIPGLIFLAVDLFARQQFRLVADQLLHRVLIIDRKHQIQLCVLRQLITLPGRVFGKNAHHFAVHHRNRLLVRLRHDPG